MNKIELNDKGEYYKIRNHRTIRSPVAIAPSLRSSESEHNPYAYLINRHMSREIRSLQNEDTRSLPHNTYCDGKAENSRKAYNLFKKRHSKFTLSTNTLSNSSSGHNGTYK